MKGLIEDSDKINIQNIV